METWQPGERKPRVEESTLKTAEFQVERKSFHLALKENPRGQYVRITEMSGKRSSVIIPAPGVEELRKALGYLME